MDKEELLKKWLSDTLSPEEEVLFNKQKDVALNHKIIESAQQFKASNFSEIKDFESIKATYQSNNKKLRRLKPLDAFLKIAGILVLTFGVYYMFLEHELTEVKTKVAETQELVLPDQSSVILNALSEISYSKDDWLKSRVVNLQGEAYFKVEHGSTFKVKTPMGVVTVLGTKFNVKQRNDYFKVKCYQGIVEVAFGNVKPDTLKAGETYQIIKGKIHKSKTSNTTPTWLDDMSTFEAEPIIEVLEELARQYDVEIKQDIIQNRLFTGGFVHDNLEEALIAITKPMNLVYEMKALNRIEIHEKKD